MPAAPNPCPAESCSSVPPPPLPVSHPALAVTAQLSQHRWHCTLMWVMSPCSNPKTHIKFIIRGFGLAFPRPGPALLSCLPCKPGISCQGGKKIQKWQETAGEEVAKSWEVMEKQGCGIWEKGQADGVLLLCWRGLAQHLQCPGKGRAQCRFLLHAQSHPLPSWL